MSFARTNSVRYMLNIKIATSTGTMRANSTVADPRWADALMARHGREALNG
nr:hypothetical protein [Stigmatella aurantiaca]